MQGPSDAPNQREQAGVEAMLGLQRADGPTEDMGDDDDDEGAGSKGVRAARPRSARRAGRFRPLRGTCQRSIVGCYRALRFLTQAEQ